MVVFRKSTSTLAKRTRKGPCKRKQYCWMLHVAPSLKPVKLFSQQLPTFLLSRDRRSVAQQCWIRLHSSSNIVGATHAHYAWITKTYGLYSSHDALQVPTLLGVVASVCTPVLIRTQQLPTLLGVVAPVCTQLKSKRGARDSLTSLTLPLVFGGCRDGWHFRLSARLFSFSPRPSPGASGQEIPTVFISIRALNDLKRN